MNTLAYRNHSVPRLQKSHSKTLLPPDSPLFNDSLENYVRYVQGANAFIILYQMFEIIKYAYLYFAQKKNCNIPSNVLISLTGLNFIWLCIAFIGISSINSRQTTRIGNFIKMLFLSGVLRGIFYFQIYIKMGRSSSQGKLFCGSIYQGDMYILQAALEMLMIGILVGLTYRVKNYLKRWDEEEDY